MPFGVVEQVHQEPGDPQPIAVDEDVLLEIPHDLHSVGAAVELAADQSAEVGRTEVEGGGGVQPGQGQQVGHDRLKPVHPGEHRRGRLGRCEPWS
ncbi:hypothetical protein ACQP2K_13325 [Microbispora siamensis]